MWDGKLRHRRTLSARTADLTNGVVRRVVVFRPHNTALAQGVLYYTSDNLRLQALSTCFWNIKYVKSVPRVYLTFLVSYTIFLTCVIACLFEWVTQWIYHVVLCDGLSRVTRGKKRDVLSAFPIWALCCKGSRWRKINGKVSACIVTPSNNYKNPVTLRWLKGIYFKAISYFN